MVWCADGPEGAAALRTEDAVLLSSDAPVTRGRRAIADLCCSWVGAGISNGKYETVTCEAQGDIAYLAETYSLKYQQTDGTVAGGD